MLACSLPLGNLRVLINQGRDQTSHLFAETTTQTVLAEG